MTISSGRPGDRHSPGLLRVLAELRTTARTASEALLDHLPDTGDHATGRAVDDFVEQAGDALRALEESLADALGGDRVDGGEAREPSPWRREP